MSVSLAHEREVWVHTRDQKTGTTELRQYQSRYGSSAINSVRPLELMDLLDLRTKGFFAIFFGWFPSCNSVSPIHEHWIKKRRRRKKKKKKKKKRAGKSCVKTKRGAGPFLEHLIRFLVLWVCVGTGCFVEAQHTV